VKKKYDQCQAPSSAAKAVKMTDTQNDDIRLSHWCTKLLKCTHMKDCSMKIWS